MAEVVIDGDRRMIVSRNLCLVFSWTNDRWVHSLEDHGQTDQKLHVLAVSVEGDAERDDPARVVSPTYQDLQFQEDGQAIQALLVGKSGPHHFSAVFAFEEAVDQVSIKVDIADRCRSSVDYLASTYTVEALSSELMRTASPSHLAWNFGSDTLNLTPITPAEVSFAESGRRATQVQAFTKPKPGSATHRLFYHWIWEKQISH